MSAGGPLEAWEAFVRGTGRTERTVRNGLKIMRQLERHAGKPVEKIRTGDVSQFLARPGVGDGTLATDFGSINAFFRWYADNGGQDVTAQLLVRPKSPKKMGPSNRVRRDRYQAQRLNLVLSQRQSVFFLRDRDDEIVFSGSLDEVEEWITMRTLRKPPGPASDPIPELWQPWLDLFVAEQKAAKRTPRTITTRSAHLGTFARRHPDLSPLEVSRVDLIYYFSGNEDWQPRTVHAVQSTFRLFFRLLVEGGHRRDDPARSLPTVRIPRSLPRPCPDEVLGKAYEQITDSKLRLAVRLAAETGMRCIELAAVKRGDVEGSRGDYRIHIVGKGGHERVVPISDELAGQLLAVSTQYVFPTRVRAGWKTADEPISGKRLGKLIDDALPGDWTAHTLRHRFGTVAYQATSDIRAVQDLLGHASPTTTAVYTQITDAAMRRAALATHLRSEETVGP
jgi:integrase